MSRKVAELRNIKIVIHHDDHGNPHVHAIGPGCEAKIYLNTFGVPSSKGFSEKALRALIRFIKQRNTEFLEAWREIYEEEK